MRLGSVFCLLLALAGISVAQDTNFPVGPQYLITSASPMFLHSIATPTLSLSAPPAGVSAPATETAAVPETASSAGPQSQPDLTRIYWGGPKVSEEVSEIEITSAPLPRALPASIVDVGVTGMTNAQSLRERGYGVPLGETASFWKARKPHAPRVYTNADLQRLHQS